MKEILRGYRIIGVLPKGSLKGLHALLLILLMEYTLTYNKPVPLSLLLSLSEKKFIGMSIK